MGTRYEDQPAEHWAFPESLDPTPVWKQYALVGILLIVGLVIVVIVALVSLAPEIAAPPAFVPGDRLVLAASELPPVGGAPTLISAPLVDPSRAFFLVRPTKAEVLALRVRWAWSVGEPPCRIVVRADVPDPGFRAMDCPPIGSRAGQFEIATFDVRGAPSNDAATHALDRYLVSVSGDRVIVNLSRVIESSVRTNAPVPTGIPQPQQTP